MHLSIPTRLGATYVLMRACIDRAQVSGQTRKRKPGLHATATGSVYVAVAVAAVEVSLTEPY
eukprot:1138175-Pelagomonas_calceolata.AAC.2